MLNTCVVVMQLPSSVTFDFHCDLTLPLLTLQKKTEPKIVFLRTLPINCRLARQTSPLIAVLYSSVIDSLA